VSHFWGLDGLARPAAAGPIHDQQKTIDNNHVVEGEKKASSGWLAPLTRKCPANIVAVPDIVMEVH
jgi:hypothetical protein